MALSIPTIGRKKPVTLQTEEQKVATPSTLASRKTAIQAPPKPAAPPPPSPPREGAPASTYGAPRPPGAPQPIAPNQQPTTPGAGTPPVGTYEAPEKPNMAPPPAEVPETVTMTMDQDVAGTMGNAPAGGLMEAVTEGPPPPSAGPSSDDELDAQIRQLMGDIISGKGMGVDTSEEEALIKQLMQDQIGQSLVDQRARMGRAGFGASGALAAMEGDIQRQAAQRATQETLATRRQAEQDAIERALSAIGVDVEKRREARQASFDEEFLNALKSYLGQEDTGAGAPSTDIVNSLFGPEPTSGLSTDNPSATKVQGNSVLDPVTKEPYEIRASANANDVKRRVLVDANGDRYAVYLDSEKSSPGSNVLYAVKV